MKVFGGQGHISPQTWCFASSLPLPHLTARQEHLALSWSDSGARRGGLQAFAGGVSNDSHFGPSLAGSEVRCNRQIRNLNLLGGACPLLLSEDWVGLWGVWEVWGEDGRGDESFR